MIEFACTVFLVSLAVRFLRTLAIKWGWLEWLQVNVENNASNLVGVSPQVDGNRIKLLIDARVNDSMRKGRYSQSMAQASDGMTGKFYGV